MPTPGTVSISGMDCRCEDEALVVLPLLAAAAKGVHDAAGSTCLSAVPIPAGIPADVFYVPMTQPGTDFNTGTASAGWICLNVPMPSRLYCQYSFTKGSSPVAASVGGPLASHPEGFEVAARGDDDGDGIVSAFSIVGDIDAGGDLVLSPLFSHDPDE